MTRRWRSRELEDAAVPYGPREPAPSEPVGGP